MKSQYKLARLTRTQPRYTKQFQLQINAHVFTLPLPIATFCYN